MVDLEKEVELLATKHGSAIGKLHFTTQKLNEAQAEINDLKQQIAELHVSRESLLEYKANLENPDYVLVPKEPTQVILCII